MNGWLIYDIKQYEKNKWFADRLLDYCSGFSDMRLIIAEKLISGIGCGSASFVYEGREIASPDFAIMRSIFPFLSRMLERAGARVFNSSTVSEICNDKRATYAAVAGSGVPIMQTFFFDKRFFTADDLEDMCFPLVLKSSSGHGGKEVFLVASSEDVIVKLREIPENGFLLQKVCGTVGRDLRVYLLGGEIIGAALRASNGFRSNYSLGGRAERYELSSEEVRTVKAVLRCLPCLPDFVGIDFLADKELIFNEVEDVVGTRMLYETTDKDAARLYSEYIRRVMCSQC